MECLEFGII